ncbi:MAG: L,D-transpeptidase [Gammaproteobacteria bacterium]|nr:L,D-transpeptidase [Gammaproteobacteria bacterium]
MAFDICKLRDSSRRLFARARFAPGCPGNPAAWLGVLVLLTVISAPPSRASGPETWVRVDTGASTLTVMRGEQVVASFPGIAVGRGGVSRERRRGDHKTPLGEFRIIKVKEPSQYHRFFIIDYPDEPRARLARDAGEIDEPTFQAIRSAGRAGRLPPQNTPLGGNLGIHGLGRGDPVVHESFHWTQGCVAVTNEQIDRLAELVRVGTRVVID